MFEDSRTEVFVCNVTNADAASYAVLPSGAGAFYYEPQTFTETALSTNSTYTHRFVHRNAAGVLRMTKPFRYSQVKNVGYLAPAALVNQVSYVGYNGTSGSLDAANSTYYSIKMVLNHTFGLLNNSPLMLTFPYKSDSSATQSEVAAGLAIAATAVKDRQANKCFKVERVNSGAQAVALNNISVVNGSNQLKSADDDTATLLTGTIVRIEEPESDGSATTDPCYIITGNDGGAGAARIYYLDQKFQGVTNADHDHCETVTEGNWGLKFTGISPTYANFNPKTDTPYVVSFDLQLGENFVTATVTDSTTPYIGSGTYSLVSAMEARSQFENKDRVLSAYPQTSITIDATTTYTYKIWSFEVWDDDYVSATTGVRPVSKVRYVIAMYDSLTEAFNTVLGT